MAIAVVEMAAVATVAEIAAADRCAVLRAFEVVEWFSRAFSGSAGSGYDEPVSGWLAGGRVALASVALTSVALASED